MPHFELYLGNLHIANSCSFAYLLNFWLDYQLKLGRSKEDLNKDVVPCFIFNCFITSNFTFSVAVAVNAINGVSGNRNFNIPNFLYDGRKS